MLALLSKSAGRERVFKRNQRKTREKLDVLLALFAQT
jgi:hypothetical protein